MLNQQQQQLISLQNRYKVIPYKLTPCFLTMNFKRISIILILLTFVPLLTLFSKDYFFLDEPNILWQIKQNKVWQESHFFYRFLSEGRPLYGFLLISMMSFAKSLKALYLLRILGLFITGVFFYIIFRFLRSRKMSECTAFITTALFFCIPGITIFMAWSECFAQHISSILSFSAGILTLKVFEWILKEERISRGKENLYVLCALILQIISLFNYQGMSLAFILPGFFALCLKPDVEGRQKIRFLKYYLLIFFLSMGVYYGIYKSLLGAYHIEVIDRGKFGKDYIGKLKWFFEIWLQASKLQLLLFKPFIIQNLFSFGVFALLLRDICKKRWMDLSLLFIFSLLSFLPHLLLAESWGASRNFLLMSFLIIFYAICRCVELFPFLQKTQSMLLILPFLAIFFINMNTGFIKPVTEDFACLSSKVKELPLLEKDTVTISIKVPPYEMHEQTSFLRSYYDEFNVSPLYFEWPVDPAIKCFYSELHPGIPVERIEKQLQVRVVSVPENNALFWDLNYKRHTVTVK